LSDQRATVKPKEILYDFQKPKPHNRTADLGAAGVYYRALVGPFASAKKAAKLCSGLKAAGGDCIIPKN
jgi:SPOR domain